jgi:hypothetical protein
VVLFIIDLVIFINITNIRINISFLKKKREKNGYKISG